MGHDDNRDQLMTTREVAERLRVSTVTVERWRYERKGPTPVRLGTRTIRYRSSDVEQLVSDRQRFT
jgi:excisionase family DNA binding protein